MNHTLKTPEQIKERRRMISVILLFCIAISCAYIATAPRNKQAYLLYVSNQHADSVKQAHIQDSTSSDSIIKANLDRPFNGGDISKADK